MKRPTACDRLGHFWRTEAATPRGDVLTQACVRCLTSRKVDAKKYLAHRQRLAESPAPDTVQLSAT